MKYSAGYEVYFCKRKWSGDISPSMLLQLWPMIRWADVVHLTAVYSSPTIPTLLICNLLGKPVVWSPRGALQRWDGATRPLEKNIWEAVCNFLIRRVKCVLHVTSAEEAAASEARIRASDHVLIPNGVEVPETIPVRTWKPDGVLRLLVIGRLHPIKGIENLLLALKILEDGKVNLSICGVGDNSYVSSLRKLVTQLGLDRCVKFKGQVEGKDKEREFFEADVCLVASHSENFSMVVAEALAHGVPVIASKGTPWAAVEKQNCGLWVENTPIGLSVALQTIRAQDLAAMGNRGRLWMESDFGWREIAKKMHAVYGDLIPGTHE